MSDKEDRERLIKEVTNEMLVSQFTQELGQKVRVERHEVDNRELMDQLRLVLKDIGTEIKDTDPATRGMTYAGSLSVHVFTSEILRTVAFAVLSNHERLDFNVADGAIRELNGSTAVSFGKSRKKLRSGF